MEKRTCVVDGCDRAVHVKKYGQCSKHYQRAMRHGTTELPDKVVATCSADGCDRELVGSTGRGMCSKHYQRWRKYGQTELPNGDVQWWHEGRGTNPDRCTMDGCDKPQKTGGLCSMHDSRERRLVLADGRPVMCEWCWNLFQPRRGNQRFCTDLCFLEHQADYARQYMTRRRRDDPNHCSDVNNHRRALLRNAIREPFSRADVLERDQWICQICGQPIDPELKFPHRMSRSIDHIIPLARGGSHTLANCQAAHLACNQAKGATTD